MNRKTICLMLIAAFLVCMLPTMGIAHEEKMPELVKSSIANKGAVISASDGTKIEAVSLNEEIAVCINDGNSVLVQAVPNAVGVAKISVTAGGSNSIVEVPVGYTTFVLDGYSVTVIAGSDDNYEIVGLNPADETERTLEQTTDGNGNTVYTGSSEAIPSIAIKKNGGVYVFEGEATDASISVKKEAKNNAFLLLNGVSVTSSFTSPIHIKKDSKASVIITAVAGTVNTLTDAEFNNSDTFGPVEDGGDGSNQFYAENAVIKAKRGAKLYLNGTGTLNINANAKNAVKLGENSCLEISEINLNVNSVYNGISSDNEINIRSGNINITTLGNDALKAENDDASRGTIMIGGGNLTINSADEGIVAADKIAVYNGTVDITCAGDGIKAENIDETDGDIYVYGGEITINSTCDGFQSAGELVIYDGFIDVTACEGHSNTAYNKDYDPSAKGLKSGMGDLKVYGGHIIVDSADDALHSNSNLYIKGGTFELASGDDGIHADYVMILGEQNGNDDDISVLVTDSYEGVEAANIYILSGNYEVYSDDDCINAANGDLSGYNFLLRMYGSHFVAHGRTGDGVDSNGEFSVYGGMLEVYAPGNANAALDCDGSMNLIGGTTIGVGSSDMVQTPDAGVYLKFGSGGWGGGGGSSISFSSGDAISIKNASGSTLFESTVIFYGNARNASSVIFASDQLTANQTYYLYKNGTQVATANAVNAGSATVPEIPGEAQQDGGMSWKQVGEASGLYSRITSMIVGIPAVITNTASTNSLMGGSTVTGTAVTVSSNDNQQYTITEVTQSNSWIMDAYGHIYCTIDGVNYYLAYSSTGGWNTSYSISITTDSSSAPTWTSQNNTIFTYAQSVGGGPGGGQQRRIYLSATNSGFGVTTSSSSVYVYSPDSAMASLCGTSSYLVNKDNGETIDEATVLANAYVQYKSSLNAQEQVLDWNDSRISMSWDTPLAMEQGSYVLSINVDGTLIGYISVTVVAPISGGVAPTPDEPPTPSVLIGDVNGDGIINSADAVLIMRHALGIIQLTGDALIAADYNQDGNVNAADALSVLRYTMGI